MVSDRRMHGYTLVEVLVAMTILAMSLTVLFRIFGSGLQNVDVAADYARAVIIAENLLAESADDSALRSGITQGTDSDRFHWSRTVEIYAPDGHNADATAHVRAYSVRIDVEWNHRGRNRSVNLNAVQLQPDDGDSS